MSMTTTPEAPASRRGQSAEGQRVGGGLLDPKVLWHALPEDRKSVV